MNSADGQRLIKWGWIVMVILAVFLAVSTIGAFRGWSDRDPAASTISVTGEGEVVAVPDVASFSFSVQAEAKTVAAAQESVTTKINAVLAALKEMGVEEKDIKTSEYSVWPKYSYAPCSPTYCVNGGQTLDGYTASHNVTVKVRKTDDAGKALGVVGEKGATNISGISFTTDDPDALLQEARVKAIANAREKAKVLTDNLDVKLGKVVTYSDNYLPGPMPVYGMGGVERLSVQDAKASPTIPQGENKIVVNVTVTYEIR